MVQSKEFVDASHALNDLSHALDLLESENASLRGAVDGLCNENAKLREQIHWLKKGDILHVLTDQEYIDQCERERLMQVSIDALDKENAKLRELCAGLLTGYECGYGELCKGCTWDGLGDSKMFSCLPRAKARDLGVEVDA